MFVNFYETAQVGNENWKKQPEITWKDKVC